MVIFTSEMIKQEVNSSSFKNTSSRDNGDVNHSQPSFYTMTTPTEEKSLLTEETLAILTIINTWGFGQCITILGLILNGLNVMTFVKQGVQDSVNISLLGLTISDLGSLVFHLLINVCWTPAFFTLDLPFHPRQCTFLLVWAHILFTRVTTGTTAWIAFERCVCIVAPLRVKSIVTPRRTVTFIVGLYVIMTGTVVPMFYTTRLTLMFDHGRNKSIYIVTKIQNREKIESVSYWGNNIIPTLFFILIVVFTAILVKALRRNSKWRQQTTSKENVMSTRDTKVSKIVLVISAVFILCYFPGAAVFLFVLAYPSMTYGGKQQNFLLGSFSLLLFLEGINASVNFFIYLGMSSKFKNTLKDILCSYDVENNESETRRIKFLP